MKPMLLRTRIWRSRGTASLETQPALTAPSEPQQVQLYRPVTEPSGLMESGKKMASPMQSLGLCLIMAASIVLPTGVVDELAVLVAVLFEPALALGQLAEVGGGDLGQRRRELEAQEPGTAAFGSRLFLFGAVALEDRAGLLVG
ncbi:hypothetical protein PG997_006962 [Apiospora hydei]|uniref:Uncharacterized protein n=1 Tax=Apiospora hydei TaxID=1337664 RepID=A0ABR1WQ72_9PEZI